MENVPRIYGNMMPISALHILRTNKSKTWKKRWNDQWSRNMQNTYSL